MSTVPQREESGSWKEQKNPYSLEKGKWWQEEVHCLNQTPKEMEV